MLHKNIHTHTQLYQEKEREKGRWGDYQEKRFWSWKLLSSDKNVGSTLNKKYLPKYFLWRKSCSRNVLDIRILGADGKSPAWEVFLMARLVCPCIREWSDLESE